MSEKPVRVQYKRGQKLPPNTVYVGRPSRWGNPFPVGMVGREVAIDMYRDLLIGCFSPTPLKHLSDGDFADVYARKSIFQKRNGAHAKWAVQTFLRGKNLACWCRPEEACHADVLLEWANE